MKNLFLILSVFLCIISGCKKEIKDKSPSLKLKDDFITEVVIKNNPFVLKKENNKYFLSGIKDSSFEKVIIEVSDEKVKIKYDDISTVCDLENTPFSDLFSMLKGADESKVLCDEHGIPKSIYSENQSIEFKKFIYKDVKKD